MPTFSQDRVSVLPLAADTDITLNQIRDKMLKCKPSLQGFTSGWASTNNVGANLRLPGVAPHNSDPVILPPTNDLPERLVARFYFWDSATARERRLPSYNELDVRLLNALDLVLTKPASNKLGILLSTRTPAYIVRKTGAIKTLEASLREIEPDFKISRTNSFLALKDEEIFLWLTVQLRDKPQLSPSLRLDIIDGLFSRDMAQRSTDLQSGIDFGRPGFLTSVAEQDTLGPIDISFVDHYSTYNDSYRIKLHIDGGFEVKKSDIHLEDNLNRSISMEESSLRLAYFLIPKINQIYIGNANVWKTKRQKVIKEAMKILYERYKLLESRI